MAIEPIGFKVLVKPQEVEEVTKGGIVLVQDEDMEHRAQILGTIIAFGEDFAVAYNPKTPRWGLKVGDRVFYAKYAGKNVKDPKTEEKVLILNDDDLCGIYREDVTDGTSDVMETKET